MTSAPSSRWESNPQTVVLLIAGLAWIAGIYAGSQFGLPPYFMLLSLAPLVFLSIRRYRKIILLTAVALLLFNGAAYYSHTALFDIDETDLRYYNDLGDMTLRGTVTGSPDARDSSTRLEVAITSIEWDGQDQPAEGAMLVFVPRYPEYHSGDILEIIGVPQTPPVLDDFDYRGYLEHRGITSVMYYPSVTVLESGTGSPVTGWIHSLRSEMADSLSEALPEPHASLAQGMLLGIRGGIPEDVREDFNRSGTAHLLAISGLHLGIMAGLLLGIGIALFGRRRGLYVWFALAGIWVYAALAGLGAPVLRAAVMASIFLVAELLGRQRSGIVALVVAAAIMTGTTPYILGDASFQMSFLAMAGISVLYPLLRDAGRWCIDRLIRETGKIANIARAVTDLLAATLAALLAVWPVIAYYFGIVSLAGPLATLLTMWALPFIIILGGITALAGLAVPVIGQAIGWLAWLFLSWLLLLTDWLGSGSSAVVEVASVHPAVIAVYYIILGIIVWLVVRWKRKRNLLAGNAGFMRAGFGFSFSIKGNGKLVLLLTLLVVAILVVSVAATMPDSSVRVSILDVGQGDAILVSRGDSQVLIDGGPGPRSVMDCLGERMPFWDRTIELVVLTHPHNDHLAGLVEVLRRYRVKQVVVPPIDYDSALYREWRRLIAEKDIPVTVVTAGWTFSAGEDIVFTVLNPVDDTGQTGDDTGLVLRLETGGISFLLTADISGEVERDLVRRRADIDADILKVSHHGSDDSSMTPFLAVVGPEIAVISCGQDNRYGHPGNETLARLQEYIDDNRLYRTDEHGTIEFTIKENGQVECRTSKP